MPANWKTGRVFISSTFRDMQAERDHLVRFVFPRLREQLLLRRIDLVDVDPSDCGLRIGRRRPRFLCILDGLAELKQSARRA